MDQYAMIIDYEYCTGCKSCEISCRKEKGLPLDEWGIKVEELGPKKMEQGWEWDYVPVLSRACDLCADRRAEGKKPLCELHCLASVIEVLPLENVSARMAELGPHKVCCHLP